MKLMEDYYENKRQKRADFIEGLLINLVVGVIAGILYLGGWTLTDMLDNTTTRLILRIILIAVIVTLVALYEVQKIRKYLRNRRYIAIGMIVGLILPLLVVGTCSPMMFTAGA